MDNMKSFIIGVGGQFESGKDEFCNHLFKILNKTTKINWNRDAFANNVKKIYCDTFGVDREFIETWKRINYPPPGFDKSVREGLIFIGDGLRNIQSTIWINLLLNNNKRDLIISDVRYINEANYIRKNNGISILIWRPGYENNCQNRSEQELMQFIDILKKYPDGQISLDKVPFDLWIKNDNTLEVLYNKIENIVVPFVTELIGKHNDNK